MSKCWRNLFCRFIVLIYFLFLCSFFSVHLVRSYCISVVWDYKQPNKYKFSKCNEFLSCFIRFRTHFFDIKSNGKESKIHCDLVFSHMQEPSVCHLDFICPKTTSGSIHRLFLCLTPSSEVNLSCASRLYWFNRWLTSYSCALKQLPRKGYPAHLCALYRAHSEMYPLVVLLRLVPIRFLHTRERGIRIALGIGITFSKDFKVIVVFHQPVTILFKFHDLSLLFVRGFFVLLVPCSWLVLKFIHYIGEHGEGEFHGGLLWNSPVQWLCPLALEGYESCPAVLYGSFRWFCARQKYIC